jgi:cation diffusion facilitator family transporter
MHEHHQKAQKFAVLSLLANILLAVTKGFVGVIGNSYALIADAIESAGDVFSSILVVLGLRYAQRPPDKNHPYGHGKAEALTTFLVVTMLFAAATLIVVESVKMIMTPHKSPEPFTLYFLLAVIVAKEVIYRIVTKVGTEVESTALKADAWHHRSDAITSLFAAVGITIALIFGDDYAQADDWAALIAAAIIYYNGIKILRPALAEVMDEHLYDEFIEQIRVVGNEIENINLIEKCNVRKSGMRYWVDVHVHVDGNMSVYDGHDIAHQLKAKLIEEFPQIEDVLVHIEPSELDEYRK